MRKIKNLKKFLAMVNSDVRKDICSDAIRLMGWSIMLIVAAIKIADASEDYGIHKTAGLATIASRKGGCEEALTKGVRLLSDEFKDA